MCFYQTSNKLTQTYWP